MCIKIALHSLFGQLELCLIFILSENKDFHSGVLLKMPTSSPSMEEFDLDIQKEISLKQAKAYLSRNNKNTLQNACFKGNSKYKEAVCSLNIHYNKNTKVQKQNETKVKKLQTKVVDSLQYIFSINKL